MEFIKLINYTVSAVFFIFYFYQFIYVVIPFLVKGRNEKPCVLHKYAVLISARNESKVISALIESIRNQSYPSELVDIFVVADNCTDNTAEIARNAGAIVWERFSKTAVGKGYAIDFLYNKILEEYGNIHDGFFIFDADNLLDPNYISEMNKTFSQGYKIITSYRNSKNYDSNWISAGYALWFLRESKFLNYSRMLLGTSCAVGGTGFLFHRSIIEQTGGWKFFLLTEDIEFTVHNVINGEKIGYCENAVVYDEQPEKFSQSWKQRLRWAKGFLQVFQNYGADLIKSIFKRKSFACYDMTMTIIPAMFLTVITGIINIVYAFYRALLGLSLGGILILIFQAFINMYLILFVLGVITTITEWDKINCSTAKKLGYTFTFPIFIFTYIPITIVAIFKNVKWEPIDHVRSTTIEEMKRN